MAIDSYDKAILRALQADASLTNAQLSETVNLSASQCSRRRSTLEANGIIKGYGAILNAEALGFGMKAITRVNLVGHDAGYDDDFVGFVNSEAAVRAAYSVSGDSDYVLEIFVHDLEEFADFIHTKLLVHPSVGQVRSEIVLKARKERRQLPIA